MDVLSRRASSRAPVGCRVLHGGFSSPWAIESPIPDMLASAVPEAECIVLFHILVEGACDVECHGHPTTTHAERRRGRVSARRSAQCSSKSCASTCSAYRSSQGGWLAAVNDVQVGKALRLLHANPVRDWTVDDLAREVALSRSVLAQRFTDLVGEAPMRYLANWRMQLGKQMMREGAHNIQEVAARVDYDSEAAFNRAFKRATGSPPAAWRTGAALVHGA